MNINQFNLKIRIIPVMLVLAILQIMSHVPETYAGGLGKIVVANRASRNISIIDAGTDLVVQTVNLPADDNPPDPMYVVNTPAANRVWVGDRANNRVVVFNAQTFEVEDILPTGAGVFHMWADQAGHQLWVVNDVDKTVTVIDPQAMSVITTVDMPADLVSDGAKPHDVTLDPLGMYAYVSFLGTSDQVTDVVVQFDTTEFEEINRATVGQDPHLSFNRKNDQLYIPCQGSNSVYILSAENLAFFDTIPFSGAHGAITSNNSQRFYTTNLPGEGIDAIAAIDTVSDTILGATNSPDKVPHNLTLTPNGKKLYVTHSGNTNNTVSVYQTNRNTAPDFVTTVIVGFNPFGLAHVR